jgi:hypothetical protein
MKMLVSGMPASFQVHWFEALAAHTVIIISLAEK